MLLTEEGAHAQVPRSPSERQKFIAAQEKSWLSLSWDRKRFTADQAETALTLLSAIAFSDYKEPIDLSHLHDEGSSSREAGSSADGGSSSQPESHPHNQRALQHHQSNGVGGRGHKNAPDNPRRNKKRPGTDLVQGPSGNVDPKKKRRRTGKTAPASVIPDDTHVACLVKSSDSEMWVLGHIKKYLPESKKYEIMDYDNDSEDQRYLVKRENIRVIPTKRTPTLDRKKPVLAVYPKTTVFYKAHLVERKGRNWAVEFEDDYYDSNKIKEVDGRFILQDPGCVS